MVIDIPSNNFPFQLAIKVKTKRPISMRVISLDPNKEMRFFRLIEDYPFYDRIPNTDETVLDIYFQNKEIFSNQVVNLSTEYNFNQDYLYV